jgi:hypothetical protein
MAQNVILKEKDKKKVDIRQETNFVEITTSQGGKAIITVGVGGEKSLLELIREAAFGYDVAIKTVGSKYEVANAPSFKTEITTSAKGYPQVTISGEGDNKVAEKYNEVVKLVSHQQQQDVDVGEHHKE